MTDVELGDEEEEVKDEQEAVSQEPIEGSGPSQNVPELFSAIEGFGITETEVTTGVESEEEPLKRQLPAPTTPGLRHAPATVNPFANLPALATTEAATGPPKSPRRVSPRRKTVEERAEEGDDERDRPRRSLSPSKRKRIGVVEDDGEDRKKTKKDE